MLTRRRFLRATARAGTGLALLASMPARAQNDGILVNDIHSQLNPTRVGGVVPIASESALQAALSTARAQGRAVCIAGGRHAMGGQQFATDAVLIDTRPMRRILALDTERGIVEAEAGMQWPELIDGLIALQQSADGQWGIIQKQTGADRLTLGGALSANIHGRGLTLAPIIDDVDSFTLVGADGNSRQCSRMENSDLFRAAIGGYGLFGIITRVRLRLMPRTKLERLVQLADVSELIPLLEERIASGFLYGDFQFSTDMSSDTFMKRGVLSAYRPLPPDTEMPTGIRELSEANWRDLYLLSHADTIRAYETYTSYYLSTSGQKYWSDTHQLSVYLDNYHEELDRRLQSPHKGSEMITELYVPRAALASFLSAARDDFRQHGAKLIYGTVRLIERDAETFLAWAREPWACTVMNLHVDHSEEGKEKAATDFRRLIDRAIEHGGSYYLTYHRWADRRQVETCYPQMTAFLRLKRQYDPDEIFQSDWYRHHKEMFAKDI